MLPLLLYAPLVLLILSPCCTADLTSLFCKDVDQTRKDVQNISFDESEIFTEWQLDEDDHAEILYGIFNLVTLRDLAKRVNETAAVDLISLLDQIVEDACRWLYNSAVPNLQLCNARLRYNHFIHMTQTNNINKIIFSTVDCPPQIIF